MADGRSIAYHLRPNKAVDREIFIELLSRVVASANDPDFRYIGLGGPFMEDFRQLHARTAIKRMTCVERDANVHMRQRFNLPLAFVEPAVGELGEYLSGQDLSQQTCALWLDFSDSEKLYERIDLFAALLKDCAFGSVVKLTLNANPGQLGKTEEASENRLHERRLQRLESLLQGYFPNDATKEEMAWRSFGKVLLRAVRVAVHEQLKGSGAEFLGISSFLYSDGQPMVTVTGAVVRPGETEAFLARNALKSWDFYRSDWWLPRVIDMPLLSTRERLVLERGLHDAATTSVRDMLGFDLPNGALVSSTDVLEMCRRFYRLYPQFAKVDL